MSECITTPVELILATTDPNLYESGKGWKWSGPLYWAVECLIYQQSGVSDAVIPNIPRNTYKQISETPVTWNYCNSQDCKPTSTTMYIVFTFKPDSKDPHDYLQYVIDINGTITDFPYHDITDNKGESFYIDIVDISRMSKQPYVEIWIAKSSLGSGYNVLKSSDAAVGSKMIVEKSSGSYLWVTIVLVVILLVIITFAGIVIKDWYFDQT